MLPSEGVSPHSFKSMPRSVVSQKDCNERFHGRKSTNAYRHIFRLTRLCGSVLRDCPPATNPSKLHFTNAFRKRHCGNETWLPGRLGNVALHRVRWAVDVESAVKEFGTYTAEMEAFFGEGGKSIHEGAIHRNVALKNKLHTRSVMASKSPIRSLKEKHAGNEGS